MSRSGVEHTFSTTNGESVLFEAGKNYLQSETGFALTRRRDTCHGFQAVLRATKEPQRTVTRSPPPAAGTTLTSFTIRAKLAATPFPCYVDGALQTPTWNLSSATNTNNFGNEPIYLLSRAAPRSSAREPQQLPGLRWRFERQTKFSRSTTTSLPGSRLRPSVTYKVTTRIPSLPDTVTVPFTAAQAAGDLNLIVVGLERQHSFGSSGHGLRRQYLRPCGRHRPLSTVCRRSRSIMRRTLSLRAPAATALRFLLHFGKESRCSYLRNTVELTPATLST